MLPKKFEIENILCEVAYSFPKVFHAILLVNNCTKEYTARVCCEGVEPITVRKKIWEYDELILEVEQRLLEISNE